MTRSAAPRPAVATSRAGRVAYDPSAGVPVAGARDIPEEKV